MFTTASSRPFSQRIFATWTLVIGLAAGHAWAELSTPLLVDGATSGVGSDEFLPTHFAEFQGHLYFVGHDALSGSEPWISDGTAAGSRRLADLCPGTCDSLAGPFVEVGDRLVFPSIATKTLYAIHDGEVEAIARGFENPRDFVRLGDTVFFRGYLDGRGFIWRTDGKAAGTFISNDFCVVENCLGPISYEAAGEAIYFATGGKLFVLSAEGDRRELAALDSAYQLTALGDGRWVFAGCQSGICRAWVTDGSAAGTFLLEPSAEGNLTAGIDNLVSWRGRVYFNNFKSGVLQLVSTDGTVAGTRLEPSFPGESPQILAANSSALLYSTRSGAATGPLTTLFARRADGSDHLLWGPDYQFRIAGPNSRIGEKIFLTASFDKLLVTDATPAGTLQLATYYQEADGLPFGGLYYFGLDQEGPDGPGLWHSDGTAAGTAKTPFDRTYSLGSSRRPFVLGESMIALKSADNGTENLFRIDPQSLTVGQGDPRPLYMIAAGRNVFFAGDADTGDTLIAFRDSSTVDVRIFGIEEPALAADDHLFFTDPTPGQELIESDGTAAGTQEGVDIAPGYIPACSGHHCQPNYPKQLTPSGDNVYFTAPITVSSNALWSWQRGQGSATVLHDSFFTPTPLIPVAGKLVFQAYTDSTYEWPPLWVTNGSAAGTHPFFEVPFGGSIQHFAVAGNRLYFELRHLQGSTVLDGLWVSDLTSAGTYRLLPDSDMQLEAMVAVGDHLFFTGKADRASDPELGFSDGTPAGTHWLELVPGPQGSFPGLPFALDDQRMVFAAAADEAGYELWISDGTLAGTSRLTDLAPGAVASSPHNFAQFGQRLFFEASSENEGHELWALDLPAARSTCPADRLCLQDGRFEVEAAVTADGQTYAGQRVLATAESGVFRFFSADNWELLVKVLDGCALNQAFWVYGSAATDLPVTLKVHDRAAATTKTYTTLAGPARPILDSSAFGTCGLPAVPAAYSPAEPPAPAASRCADDPTTLCLGPSGRYRARLDWQTATASGQALPVANGSADSALFTFFSPSNWEMMVKLLDGCTINNKRWVYAAGTTDVAWTLTVTDRNSGAFKTYHNTLGEPSKTITDSDAFACN